jgi:hypothetical protein
MQDQRSLSWLSGHSRSAGANSRTAGGAGSQAPTPPTVWYSVVFYSSRLSLSSLLPVRLVRLRRLVRQQLLLRLLL